jgi:hypothetical protein
MKIDLAHTKDPLIGWNIQVKASAGKGERISAVRISVNGFDVLDKKVDPPQQTNGRPSCHRRDNSPEKMKRA